MKKILLLVFMISSLCACSKQNITDVSHHLYKIEKNGHYLYLLGSMPVGKKYDRLDNKTEEAYQESEIIITEMLLDNLNNRNYFHKEPIRQVCKQESLDILMENLNEYSTNLVYFNEEKLASYNPVIISQTLQTAVFRELGYSSQYNLERYFTQKGKNDHKKFDEFETINNQEEKILELSREYGDHVLQQAANHSENVKQQKQLIEIYYNGSKDDMNNYCNDIEIKLSQKQMKDYENIIIKNKNEQILEKIENCLNTDEIEFMIADIKYIHGRNGVMSLLEQKNYEVIEY